jgi:hypothetical protein
MGGARVIPLWWSCGNRCDELASLFVIVVWGRGSPLCGPERPQTAIMWHGGPWWVARQARMVTHGQQC